MFRNHLLTVMHVTGIGDFWIDWRKESLGMVKMVKDGKNLHSYKYIHAEC